MSQLIQFINNHGIYAILFFVFLEYACFPISSEIILPLSGAIACTVGQSYILMVIASSAAGLLGTYMIYLLSFKLSQKLNAKLDRQSSSYRKCQDMFARHGRKAVMFSRVIPLCRTYIALPAGISRLPSNEYLTWSAAGIIIWNSILIGAGYVLGSNWYVFEGIYKKYKIIVLITLLTFSIILIALKLIKSKYSKRYR